MVNDEEERQDELTMIEGCPYSSQFVSFIQSEKFGNGLRRMISHHLGGKPLSSEDEQAIEAVQSLDVKCVYAIRTFLRHEYSGTVADSKCDDAPCFLDETFDTKCLYMCFHPKSGHVSNVLLLDMVVQYIMKMLGGSINALHLRAVLQFCDPSTVEEILNANHVTPYRIQYETDCSLLQFQEGKATTVENDLELILTCNFREGELVKYCSEDSHMVIARVKKVESEKSEDDNYPFPPTLLLKLSPRSDGEYEEKKMNSLLVCKFLSPQQITHLQSLSAIQGDECVGQNSCSELSQEIDVLLELPCREKIQCYLTGISNAIAQYKTPQKFFAIERLLFQLHYDCVHRNGQPEAFQELVEVLKANVVPHCTDEAFIQSLESNICRLLQSPVQPDPLEPNVVACQSYTELSSWSIPPEPSNSGSMMHVGGSSYRGQCITPPQPSENSTRQERGSQSIAQYPVLPAPERLRTGGAYIWGGGIQHGAQQSIWPIVTEDIIPVPAPTVSLEDAFMWLKDACRTVQLVKELEDVTEVVDVPNLEGVEQTSVYKYPETLCFYAHEIVLKCLKAVFFAYCGLPNQLVECSNLVQLHQTLMDKLAGNHEAQSILGATVRSYVHLVSGHGDCCRFPSYEPPALPCDTHSPAVAMEVLRSAMYFVMEIQKLAKFHAFFPEGLDPESFAVARPDSWTAQEGGKCASVQSKYSLFIVN